MLRKRGKTFYLDLAIAGKRIRESLHTQNKFMALDKAQIRKDELIEEIRNKKVPFTAFCDKYLEWARAQKPASADREGQRLGHIKTFFASLNIRFLSDVTPYHIEQLRGKLREGWPPVMVKDRTVLRPRSLTTINRYSQLLRGMFYRAHDWGLYKGDNPLKKIRFYREGAEIRPLTNDQVSSIINAAKEIALKPQSSVQAAIADMIILALNTGLRRAELLGLRWENIGNGEMMVKGKGGKVRTIPLNNEAQSILEKQKRGGGDGYVFDIPNRNQHDLMRRTYQAIRKRTGIRFWFHGLRHAFATSLVEKGVDFVTIAELLGHSRLSTSLIYSHTNTERKRRAVALLQSQTTSQKGQLTPEG